MVSAASRLRRIGGVLAGLNMGDGLNNGRIAATAGMSGVSALASMLWFIGVFETPKLRIQPA